MQPRLARQLQRSRDQGNEKMRPWETGHLEAWRTEEENNETEGEKSQRGQAHQLLQQKRKIRKMKAEAERGERRAGKR